MNIFWRCWKEHPKISNMAKFESHIFKIAKIPVDMVPNIPEIFRDVCLVMDKTCLSPYKSF